MTFKEFKKKYQKVEVEHFPNQEKEEPMVSVCVMTYQHVDYIKDCLEGILMQNTNFSFEILLGEDDSKDGTKEICIEYARKYPKTVKLFLHKRENNIKICGNPTGRFNFLYNLFNAKGKFIAICEGDDYWTDPLKLQKQVDFLNENENFSAACQSYRNKFFDDDKLEYGPIFDYKPMTLTLLFRNIFESYPIEFLEASNGDTFLRAMLKEYGKFHFVKDLSPCVRNVHDGGAVSRLDELNLWPRRIRTHEAILKYFQGTESEVFYKEKLARFKIKYNSLILKNLSFFKKSRIIKNSFKEALNGHSMIYFIKIMILRKD